MPTVEFIKKRKKMRNQFPGGPLGGPPKKVPPPPRRPGEAERKSVIRGMTLLWLIAIVAVVLVFGLALLSGLDLLDLVGRFIGLIEAIFANFAIFLCGGVCFSMVLMGMAGFVAWQYHTSKK